MTILGLGFEGISAIVFILLMSILIYIERRKLIFTKVLFPLFYVIQYKTSWGLRLMERFGKKHKHILQFIGLCSIGVGFFVLGAMAYLLVKTLVDVLTIESAQSGLALVVPGITIPGMGKLGFWHWIISIFVLAAVHEFAHGIMAYAHDIKVRSSGLAVLGVGLPVLPAAYVEPDEKQLEKADDVAKYSVFVAGPISNFALGAVLLMLLSLVLMPIASSWVSTEGVIVVSQEGAEELPAYSEFSEPRMIVELNNQSIKSVDDFKQQLVCKEPGEVLEFKDNESNSFAVSLVEDPDDPGEPKLGVNVQNKIYYQQTPWKQFFIWIINLVRWMAYLNIAIGAANLIPAGPFDGGHMYRTLMTRLYGKEKSAKICGVTNLFLLLVIVVLLSFTYVL